MGDYKVFTVNPGSTSTKIALFEGDKKVFSANVSHDAGALEKFETLADQLAYRKETIGQLLKENQIDLRGWMPAWEGAADCWPWTAAPMPSTNWCWIIPSTRPTG